MFATIIRTLIVYLLLLLAMRITGKRQIGELQLSELITALLLSEIASMPISDLSIPLLYSVMPLLLIICLEILLPCVAGLYPFISKLLEGHPTIIIKKGVVMQNELDRAHLSINELICELRLKNIYDISDVEYAILEQNGKLTVIPKEKARGVTLEDLNITSASKGFAHPLILSGTVSEYNLRLTGKNKKWLLKTLGSKAPEDIFLMTIDDLGNITLIEKDKKG